MNSGGSKTSLAGSEDVKLRPLAKVLDRKLYPPDSAIFTQGDVAEKAYMILRGEVDISAINKNGKTVHLTTLHSGQVFGEMALLVGKPRSASARTKSACELLTISKAQLDEKMRSLDPLMKIWVETLAERILVATRSAK
ncbi:MAG: cyclic nucleotide-binding domain-containing protein [Rhodospirillaceae bacterium]|nr:cyclic nucleotide-binding domain-containing protein [Rhodospirillaceae bacterium]